MLGSGSGQPLDPVLRHGFEDSLGHNLAGVRLHTGGEAAESARVINARAYSVGQDIVFGSGAYAPGTDRGQRLLAHELTHTIQESGKRPVELSRALEVGAIDDVSEHEADAVANVISLLHRPDTRAQQLSPAPGPAMVRRRGTDQAPGGSAPAADEGISPVRAAERATPGNQQFAELIDALDKEFPTNAKLEARREKALTEATANSWR